MLFIILLIIQGTGVQFPQLYINDSYPTCQFAGLAYTGWCCRVLKETNSKIALTMHLPSWRTVLKQINIKTKPDVSQAIKYAYINLNIGYGNNTIKFISTTKFLGVQIDDNLIIT